MLDLCAVVHPINKGWILDRMAKELCLAMPNSAICYEPDSLPDASRYFITHYSMLPAILQQVDPFKSAITCFFTHRKPGLDTFTDALNLCHSVIAESPEGVHILESIGVHPTLIHFVPEGGDSTAFQPHERTGQGSILICQGYYPRKNVDLLLEVVSLLPDRKFLLLGKGWNLPILPNLTYLPDRPYSEYPSHYATCDVYFSPSKVEGGGPNSLIEAMHANLFPVASDTGNARQYITSGYNGLIFPVSAKASEVSKLIEQAYLKRPKLLPPYSDVSETVASFTWDNWAKQITECLTGVYIHEDSDSIA